MQLHYTENGKSNITLVFLHYFGGASSSWKAVIGHLQNNFHCLAVDLPGFGSSPAPRQYPLTPDNSTDAVIQLIQHLQLSHFILVGHSMGGKIALNIAASQPAGLEKVILVAPSPPTPEPMTEDERRAMTDAYGKRAAVEKMINDATAHTLPTPVFEAEMANNLQVSAIAWRSWPQWGSKEDISAKMKHITVPVAIIGGAADKKFTKDFLQAEFSKYFNKVQVHEVPDSGHLLPAEAPEATAKWIKQLTVQQ